MTLSDFRRKGLQLRFVRISTEKKKKIEKKVLTNKQKNDIIQSE